MRLLSSARRHYWGLSLALVLAVMVSHGGTAQVTGQAGRTPDEVIEIEAGDVFEILAHSDDPTASAVWVLTQDRAFIEASRSNMFRTRQVKPGEYLLDATITEPMLDSETRRIFLLRIVPHTPVDPAVPTVQPGEIVVTTPRARQNVVTLPKNFHVLRFEPDRSDTAHFAVVLDATASQAQPDNLDTYSYSEASGLFVWFARPRDRTMEVAIQRKDGTIARGKLQLKIGEEENIVSSQGILANAREDGTVRFALQTPPLDTHVLALWDFGDGTQSLLMNPAHRYARDGTYVVRVSVRDIMNGKVLNTAQTIINVTGIDERTGTGSTTVSSSSSSAQSSSSVESTGGSGAGFFSTILDRLNSGFVRIILAIVGIIVLLGLVVLVIMRLLSRSKLDKTLETAESLLMKQNAAQAVIDAPAAPLQVKRAPKTEELTTEVIDAEDHPVVREAPPTSTEPHIDESAAPTWLKKGLGSAATEPVVEPAPEPEPMVEPVPEPVPEPEPEPIPEPEPVVVPEPVMQAEPEPVVEPVPAPIAEPTPVPEPMVAPEPEPIAAPVAAAPAPTPAKPVDDAKAEREREKRRLKRQRYRQNLKKREQEKKVTAPTPVAAPEPIVDTPTPDPVIEPQPQTVITSESPVVDPVMTSEPNPSPSPSPSPTSLPPENFAEELPAAQPSSELPAAKASSELPPANPATELPAPTSNPTSEPVARNLAEPPVLPTDSDEDVKFIIRADNVGTGDDQSHL